MFRKPTLWFLTLVTFSQYAVAGTIGTSVATPSSVSVGVGTQVTVTSLIVDPSVIASTVLLQQIDSAGRATVLGNLHDDGVAGDATAGDKIYTLQTTIFQQNPGAVTLRVSAGFQGSLLRAQSPPIQVSVTGTGTSITIVAPAQSAYLGVSPVLVTGTVSDSHATVTVNSVAAQVSGNSFSASVPLQEGTNTITAVALNTGGGMTTDSRLVTLDTTPPHVTISAPSQNGFTTASAVNVSGIINDIVVGTVNNQQATVTVNGVPAQVSNRTYVASNVPLNLGSNIISATGTDRAGNAATTSVSVTRQTLSTPAVSIVSGNNLTGAIRTQLAAPLVVKVTDASGAGVPNTPVVFQVTGGDGAVTASGPPGMGSTAVNTNAQGQAQVFFILGSHAGAGNNMVQASSAGIFSTPVFSESATAAAPSLIVIDSGNNQSGVVGQALPLPFIAIVTDSGNNRLGNVPVTFTVKQGGGTIGGLATISTISDGDGRAQGILTLGPLAGPNSNLVEANFAGNAGLPATYTATSYVPGPAQNTAISGTVLDNSNIPIAGATMRLYRVNDGSSANTPVQIGTPVPTNAQGYFLIQPAPVGVFKLMADGSTAPNGGPFPTLEYDLVTVSGQNNTVGAPIYLPQLSSAGQLCVTATTGGTLTVPQAPGFALTIAPGSATFPGGARSGCVSVTPVNADKIPMVPGFGQQPRFIVTIQPVGTTFNPPAAITIPNVDGLAPRAVTEMYSYDHDLAAFTAIGTGTVSADGSVIASDPGVGVLKAGWHCGGDPNANGTVADCPTCKWCQGNACVTDPAQANMKCTTAAVPIGACTNGDCQPVTATLKSVTFSGASFHNVAKDSDGTNYGTPQWTSTGDSFPVSYTMNTTITVAAQFMLDKPITGATAKVTGDGPNGLHVEGPGTIAGTTLTFAATAFTGPLPATIKKFNAFQITWKVSLNGGTNYSAAGASTNKMYVTLADPGPKATILYETILDIGARNADGQNSAAGAVPLIWANFSTRSVLRADGVTVMGYWTGGAATCQSLGNMLGDGNGSCIAWSQLWHQTLEAEGITGSQIFQITADTTVNPGATGFLVKDWRFGRHIRTGPNGLNNSDTTPDDVAVFPKNKGFPSQPCVGPGANGVIDTVPGAGNVIAAGVINTGPDGICNSTAAGDDVQLVPVGQGAPDNPAITPGVNGTLDSTAAGDDTTQDGLFNGARYPYLLFSWTDVFGASGSPFGDAAEQPGIPGQRNPNPPPLFFNHYVVKYNGMVWDPSYGAGPYASELAHQNVAIDGIAASGKANRNVPAVQALVYSRAAGFE